VCCS